MDFGVTLEIVSSDKTLLAVVAAELSVTEMSLHMRLDVLFATKAFVAVFVLADPLLVDGVRPFDELCDVVKVDVGFLNGSTYAWLKVEVGD